LDTGLLRSDRTGGAGREETFPRKCHDACNLYRDKARGAKYRNSKNHTAWHQHCFREVKSAETRKLRSSTNTAQASGTYCPGWKGPKHLLDTLTGVGLVGIGARCAVPGARHDPSSAIVPMSARAGQRLVRVMPAA